jgi:O-antigen biosynthesis protein
MCKFVPSEPDVSPSASTAICVLGMHRSGTSAMAGLLRLLGVNLGRNLMTPAPDNPAGFWEHSRIVSIHATILQRLGSQYDDINPLPKAWTQRGEIAPLRDYLRNVIQTDFRSSPLWGFKDPRLCRLIPIWRELFQEMGIRARYVLVVREPHEIAESITCRGNQSYNQALLSTLIHKLQAEFHTRGSLRVVVPYADLLADWRRQAERIGTALGVQWPNAPEQIAPKVSEFIDPKLRHHVSPSGGLTAGAGRYRAADPRIVNWVLRAHEVLASAADDPAAIDKEALDAISAEMEAQWRCFSGWRVRPLETEHPNKLRDWALRLQQNTQRLLQENRELRARLAQ